MNIKVDKILGREREEDRSLNYSFSRKQNSTSIYLEHNGTFSNLTPVVITEDCLLKSISASTNGNETWVAEIHANGVLIPGATVNITGADNGITNDLGIVVTAGTKLSGFCNGTNINRPTIIVELIK